MLKKILVVDESDTLRQSLKLLLEDSGYDAAEAHNGAEALKIIESGSIGLLISDVNMPEMDGISLLKKLKTDNDKKHIPVIFLTSETDDDMITEGRLAGASAWMIKPHRDDLLMEAVRRFFNIK